MAYNAANSTVVLFGGETFLSRLGDTKIWDGNAWGPAATVKVTPRSGPPQTATTVKGIGFYPFEDVTITFVDSVNGQTLLATVAADGAGSITKRITVPFNATIGTQKIVAAGTTSGASATAKFTVT
jgi:hypothetical protein